jgi:hypothetical protein
VQPKGQLYHKVLRTKVNYSVHCFKYEMEFSETDKTRFSILRRLNGARFGAKNVTIWKFKYTFLRANLGCRNRGSEPNER